MSDDSDKRAMDELLTTLKSRTQFVKVHAGEFLIWLGHPREVREEFLRENELYSKEPKYRIVLWRVLAQTEEEGKRAVWTDKILEAFKDTTGPDRIHAAETLGKLKLSPLEKYPHATMNALQSDNRNLNVYTLWAISFVSESSLQ